MQTETIKNYCLIGVVFSFCWLGLGTPFIWLIHNNPEHSFALSLTYKLSILVICVVTGLSCLFKISQIWRLISDNFFASLFMLYLVVSLAWSPASELDKIEQGVGISLCASFAIFVALRFSIQRFLEVSIFSLSSYVTAYVASYFCGKYLNLEIVFLFYVASFIIFFVLYLRKSFFNKYHLIFISVLMILCLSVEYVLGFVGFNNNTNFALFINENLFSILFQVLFISILLYSTLYLNNYIMYCLVPIVLLFVYIHESEILKINAFLYLIFYLFVRIGLIFISRVILKFVFLSLCATASLMVLVQIVFVWDIGGFQALVPEVRDLLEGRRDTRYRMYMWRLTVEQLEGLQHVFGVGLGGFWGGEHGIASQIEEIQNFTHVHNGFVDMYLQLGLVGCGLFVVALTITMKKHLSNLGRLEPSKKDQQFALIYLLVLVFLVLMNLFETTLLPTSSSNFLIFVMLIWLLFYTGSTRPNTPSSPSYQ